MLGPNGVGKSTIFNLITGLLSPDYGSIFINSELVNKYPIYQRTLKFKIGFVPQYGGYFRDLTLHDNLKAIREIVIDEKNNRSERINYLISKFDLSFELERLDNVCSDIFISYIMIICALKAPASLNASRIAIKSALLVPIALIASTMSDNVVPVSKTKAERTAWEFMESKGLKNKLTTINPGGVFGLSLIHI